MKRFFAIVLTALIIMTASVAPASAKEEQKEFRALYYDMFDAESMIMLKDNSKTALKNAVKEVVAFATDNGFSAIFLKGVSSAGAIYDSKYLPNVACALSGVEDFDLMQYFLDTAHKNSVSVYVVADIGKTHIDGYEPAEFDPVKRFSPWIIEDSYWNIGAPSVQKMITSYIEELSKTYNVDGIMVDGFWYANSNPDDEWLTKELDSPDDYRRASVEALLSAMSKAAKTGDENIDFGTTAQAVWASKNFDSRGTLTYGEESYYDNFADTLSWLENVELDFIAPKMQYAITNDDMNYRVIAEWWEKNLPKDVKIYTINMPDLVGESFEKKYEIVNQIQINRNLEFDGHILNSYSSLSDEKNEIMSVIEPLYALDTIYDMSTDLKIKSGFKTTRPEKSATVSYETYFITGICDPDEPVYMNGKKLESVGNAGVFGAFVELKVGKNTFTFTQGDNSKTVTVTREAPATTSKVNSLSSRFPSYDDFVYAGKEVTISCTGPSGAKVTAEVFGEKIVLNQTQDAKGGMPVKFSAKVTAKNDSPDDEVVNIGKVKYTLIYNDNTKEYTSSASLFYVGENAKPAIKVIEPLGLGTVYKKADSNSDVTGYMYTGTVEYITGSSGNFFTLPMGGYIPKSSVDPVAGKNRLSNEISDTKLKLYDGYEKIILDTSKRSAFTATMTEEKLVVTIYNVTSAADIDLSKSKVLSSCTITQKDDCVVYTFEQSKEKALWGYHISYDGDDTNITLKYPPTLSDSKETPLKDVTIMVDPGHGDADTGAWGVAGMYGPTEKDLNMAISEKVVDKLKELGATVYTTRTTDIKVDFEGRLGFSDAIKPDIFLSVHHNSVNVNADMSKPNGIEVFYHSEINSKNFAQNIVDYLAEYTGRAVRGKGAIYADYRVTRLYYAPSVLIEIGFMPNPTEYSDLVKPETIEKEAQAIVDAIIKTLKEY